MLEEESPRVERVRTAEVIAALSQATDLSIGVPLEHGLHSTLFAMRLGEHLGVDSETASQTYYSCLLFYIGCTAGAELAAELFGDDDALTTYATPGRFGSRLEMMTGFMRALAPPGNPPPVRALQIVRGIPRAASALKTQVAAQCEVGQMLTDRLGLPTAMRGLFVHLAERWDGKGQPGHVERDDIPLPVRIVHVARDAAFQRMLSGEEFAARVIRERGGNAFDPDIAELLADGAAEILALDDDKSAWEETLDSEPTPRLTLEGEAIDEALAAMGDFSDLVSRFLVGHSAGVAKLATAAARQCGFEAADVAAIRRAALVHDLGRIAVPVRIWNKAAPLTPDDWERVRLHAYQTERVLSHSPFLAALAPVATTHHERLDGSGYHRGMAAAALTPAARVLAAADAFHAMTEPRPHREALRQESAAETLGREACAGRLDADAVAAVLEVSGQEVPRIERPAGLTDREAQVVGLLARGLQTKQIARALGISVKTADRHIQNAYRKIGVSTRAAAALFAMQHGLAAWGELPISRTVPRS
ncbi:MAG: LuxR C-terminal-related transcriptional regulator [Actinomycetota bacterium]|nr:LuxR C-terminal-related transcriptional regulator [Actinomycetota bacterium]